MLHSFSWVLAGADVVAHRLPLHQQVPAGLAQEGEGLDPEVEEPGPEVVVEGGRIFEPEDVEVPRDGDRVEEEQPFQENRAPERQQSINSLLIF